MTTTLDRYMRAFVDFAASCANVVDIGAAYGVATIPALQAGASVIAVDTDERHLQILFERTPADLQQRLTTRCAVFPEETNFEQNSIGAFLLARVAHFLTPTRLETSASYLYQWLAPGGKVFLTAETPYLKNWESFIPVYESRRNNGNLWPGYVDNVMAFAPERGLNLPKTMLFLDPDVLHRVFDKAGFTIEKVDFLPRPEFPSDMRRDGRESVGLIASKT